VAGDVRLFGRTKTTLEPATLEIDATRCTALAALVKIAENPVWALTCLYDVVGIRGVARVAKPGSNSLFRRVAAVMGPIFHFHGSSPFLGCAPSTQLTMRPYAFDAQRL
jgi:hypothetical protein